MEKKHWNIPDKEDKDKKAEVDLTDSVGESAESKAKRGADEITKRLLNNQPKEK